MIAGAEKLSDKETDRAAMAKSKEAPQQPQKNRRTHPYKNLRSKWRRWKCKKPGFKT